MGSRGRMGRVRWGRRMVCIRGFWGNILYGRKVRAEGVFRFDCGFWMIPVRDTFGFGFGFFRNFC